MDRRPVKPNVDKKVFTKSASTHRSININPRTYRGGIRL